MTENLVKILQEVLQFDEDSATGIAQNISSDDEILRLSQILRSKKISENSINNDAYSIKWIHNYFLLESLVYYEPGKKSDKLRSLFKENLDEADKKSLLVGFTFSKAFNLGESWYPTRHVMFDEFMQDDDFKEIYLYDGEVPDFCSFNTCFCGNWLNENNQYVNSSIDKLVDKFREIRNSFVHEAFPILLLPSYEGKKTAASFTASVIDIYPVLEKNKYRAYECYLDPDIFFPLITKCIKNFINKKYINNDE